MIRDRKGMIAMMDAMIFLIILTMVSASLFAYTAMDDAPEPMAKEVCDNLMSMELRACDIYATDDTQIYPIYVLLAANMNTDREKEVYDYVGEILDGLIPKVYGYELQLSFNGHGVRLERASDRGVTSEYSDTLDIPHTGGLYVSLNIH